MIPTFVTLVEVGPRDGLQSVKATMPTPDKLRWIDALAAAGLIELHRAEQIVQIGQRQRALAVVARRKFSHRSKGFEQAVHELDVVASDTLEVKLKAGLRAKLHVGRIDPLLDQFHDRERPVVEDLDVLLVERNHDRIEFGQELESLLDLALIGWAVKNGKVPIFFSYKSDLYSAKIGRASCRERVSSPV